MGRQSVAFTRASQDAVAILGAYVRQARQDRRLTVADVAARAGVSPRTVSAIESGSPSTAIGNVMKVAIAVGVPLFDSDSSGLARLSSSEKRMVALLPSRVVRDISGRDSVDVDF